MRSSSPRKTPRARTGGLELSYYKLIPSVKGRAERFVVRELDLAAGGQSAPEAADPLGERRELFQ